MKRVQPPHNGQINLYALVLLPHLFVSVSGHLWSTARGGLRQRKMYRYKGLLMARVSRNGHVANFTGGSLLLLAHLRDWRVHWNGTRIVEGWTYEENDTRGDGPTAKIVDTAPRS